MESVFLVGAEDVRSASRQMVVAAESMQSAASRLEAAFDQHQRWGEEFLARIEAIANKTFECGLKS